MLTKTAADLALTPPMVHTGGTSRAELTRGYEGALHAAGDLLTKLDAIEFNARDYYRIPGPEGAAWTRAKGEQKARIDAVRRVYEELGALLSAVETV